MGERGPEVYEAFARELGLNAAAISWHTSRARMVEDGVWLATLLGALGKMAGDIVFLAATEVGAVFEPHFAGRGGSSAMPHKRNPVACTLIIAGASAAKGHVMTLLDSLAAGQERPAGAWHAEWHALPQVFGLVAGALREAKLLAHGLVVDEVRMRANMDATRGLLFADAAAGVLAGKMGREAAHHCVELAAGKVRETGQSLAKVLAADKEIVRLGAGDDLAQAFDLTRSVQAAALWTDRACAHASHTLQQLTPKQG